MMIRAAEGVTARAHFDVQDAGATISSLHNCLHTRAPSDSGPQIWQF